MTRLHSDASGYSKLLWYRDTNRHMNNLFTLGRNCFYSVSGHCFSNDGSLGMGAWVCRMCTCPIVNNKQLEYQRLAKYVFAFIYPNIKCSRNCVHYDWPVVDMVNQPEYIVEL